MDYLGNHAGGIRCPAPTISRIFGFDMAEEQKNSKTAFCESKGSLGVGQSIGDVVLADGTTVAAGRMLMRDEWNTALHDPLEAPFRESQQMSLPDARFHKARLSGLWAGPTDCLEFLDGRGIRTLLFGGINTDQCVLASIQDASNRGFDTVFLEDGCGTDSPDFASEMVAFNCRKSWGFVSSCESLARSTESMKH